MIASFSKLYLKDAMTMVANMLDYAVNDCKLSADEYFGSFIASGISSYFEKANPKYLSGVSGAETVWQVQQKLGSKKKLPPPKVKKAVSREHWAGSAIAYYQWVSRRTYSEITNALPINKIIEMYPSLYKADISKFVEVVENIIKSYYKDTNLKNMRTLSNLSQAMLADDSGVNLRSIQFYEQRRKDINKASAETVLRLAQTLSCSMESLLEK